MKEIPLDQKRKKKKKHSDERTTGTRLQHEKKTQFRDHSLCLKV